MQHPVYLDYNATTPVDPEVVEAMLPYLQAEFGNPSSEHVYGRRAAAAIQDARRQTAELIGAPAGHLYFTGCATEANNLAIRGAARALRDRGRHIITSAVEHPSVSMPCRRLAEDGWELSILPVDGFGRVSPEELAAMLRPDTVLVSVMHANNEVGTVQPIGELGAITRSRGVLLHCDAAQSAGKIPVDVDHLGVDLLTLAGHKFYAPKGVGALYLRPGTPIAPVLVGGGHERGLRPGTENVAGIVAMGAAAQLAGSELTRESAHLRKLRDRLHTRLLEAIPALELNGHPDLRLPNTLNVSFPGVDGPALLAAVAEEVAASVGSACHEETGQVSGVLAAMGTDAARARGAVRLSVGRFTGEADLERAAEALARAWADSRQNKL